LSKVSDESDNVEIEGEEGILAQKETFFDDSVYPANIKFSTEHSSVYELKRQFEDRKQIDMTPSYQRQYVWSQKQKSELIESILMGIPLPIMYFFENSKGMYQVVDGKQRLSSLFDFINNKYSLSDLTILRGLKGKKFKELEASQQVKIEDHKIFVNVIQFPTPDRVKFDIFDRVNRGGSRLNNQEMRNAIYQGKATFLLERLTKNPYFLKATDHAVKSKVMKDRYVINRMIAFYLWQKKKLIDIRTGEIIEYKSDIDDFLGKTLTLINKMDDSQIDNIEKIFEKSIKRCYEILGVNAFRVSTYTKSYQKRPINMALFEVLCYLMTYDFNIDIYKEIKIEVKKLFENNDFIDAITSPVDSSIRVNKRFDFVINIAEKYTW